MLLFLLDVLTVLVLGAFMMSCISVQVLMSDTRVKPDEKRVEVSACFLLFIVLMLFICVFRGYII